jgi:hypothetical protein
LVTKSTLKRTVKLQEIHKYIQFLVPKNYENIVHRIGGDFDGGYLIPKFNYSGVISPGTGDQVDFENYFANNGIKVVCIDGSVQRPNHLSKNAIFLKKFLSSSINDKSFITLEKIIRDYFPQTENLLLQCDIEGSEWEIFKAHNPNLFSIFAVITIEIHYLNQLIDREFLENYFAKFVSNLEHNFIVINCNPNNAGEDFYLGFKRYPEIIELTMVNKKLYNGNLTSSNAFSKLNKPNVTYKKTRNYSFLK